EDVFDCDALLVPRADHLLERQLILFADDEHDPAEAGAVGIVDRIVHDGFAIGTNRIELFWAAVTAAHSGCQDEECGGNHCFSSFPRFHSGSSDARFLPAGCRAWALRTGRGETHAPA